jgi:hypothetical protein
VALLDLHAIRHRSEGSIVFLRIDPAAGGCGAVDLVIEARPAFHPRAWRYFEEADAGSDPDTPGLFRLTTASRMLHACGATAGLIAVDHHQAVQIRCVRA